jgi:hypothetical protein
LVPRGLPAAALKFQQFGGQSRHQPSNQEVVAELRGKLGDPDLDLPALRGLSNQLLAEHLMILLANNRSKQTRAKVVADMGELILQLDQRDRINKLLALMPQVGRIVDIYPLEVLVYLLERAPEYLTKHDFEPFVRNRDALMAGSFAVGDSIEIKVPLALKMRAFALDGGGNPGYTFAPGPPGAYFVEFGQAGCYPLLLRGEIRRQSHIDRFTLQIHDIGDS